MTVLEASPSAPEILTFVDESVRALQESGLEPRFIVVGPVAYGRLAEAVRQRFGRASGAVEQYQWLTVVVDPFRADACAVLPTPREVADGVRAERVDP